MMRCSAPGPIEERVVVGPRWTRWPRWEVEIRSFYECKRVESHIKPEGHCRKLGLASSLLIIIRVSRWIAFLVFVLCWRGGRRILKSMFRKQDEFLHKYYNLIGTIVKIPSWMIPLLLFVLSPAMTEPKRTQLLFFISSSLFAKLPKTCFSDFMYYFTTLLRRCFYSAYHNILQRRK